MNEINETQFTPGPWHVAHSRSLATPFVLNFTGKLYIANTVQGETQDEAEANARLIAAAPDLLNALELVLQIDQISGEAAERFWPQLKQAKAAIAKAKGAA